ncbi:nucleoid-associated protein [Jutongia sp.]
MSELTQDEIIIRKGIVHILDAELGYPVFSEELLDLSPDTNDFFRGLIYKIMSGDEMKKCFFDESGEQSEEMPWEEDSSGAAEPEAYAGGTESAGYAEEESDASVSEEDGQEEAVSWPQTDVYALVKEFSEENMVEDSKKLAQALYDIMNANVTIPSADFAVVTFQVHSMMYLGLLKMNYKESYVHMTQNNEEGRNINQIIRYRSMLPSATTKLSEAVIIDLTDYSVQIIEKKYDINGRKVNYLSELYLHCHAAMSSKTKLDIVVNAVKQVNNKHYSEEPVKQLEAKRIIKEEMEETGSVSVEKVSEKLYGDVPQIKEEFDKKMEKYHMETAEVTPQSERTTKKFEKQYLKTDTGIEINIPMEQYQDADQIEFITNPDGTISVLIKNINKITTR